MSYRPFRQGEHIEVSGYQGMVTEIDFRYTTLKTEEKTILLPNASLFTNTVVVLRKDAPAKVEGSSRARNDPLGHDVSSGHSDQDECA